jgi:molecular chaperone DnaK
LKKSPKTFLKEPNNQSLDALKDSKLGKSEVNDIILVGGSTRMPQVKKIVQDIFGKEPKATVNPDEAVAAGAAIQGGIIQGDVTDILLDGCNTTSLAVEVEGGLAHVMIERNTTIPAKKSNTYTTAGDNQNAVTVHVVQGERQFAKDNKSLGMFNFEGIPNMRRWEPKIEVTFDIDANGILMSLLRNNLLVKNKSNYPRSDRYLRWRNCKSKRRSRKICWRR